MTDKKTPFEKWWNEKPEADRDDDIWKRIAHEAWIAALEHARQLMREPEETE
jgi:hypothetical protein